MDEAARRKIDKLNAEKEEMKLVLREERAESRERWDGYKGAAAIGGIEGVVGEVRIGTMHARVSHGVALASLVMGEGKGLVAGMVRAARIRTIMDYSEKAASKAVDMIGLKGRIDAIKNNTPRVVAGNA